MDHLHKTDCSRWKDLYIAALFEVDRSVLPDRIAQAQTALVQRARQLFYTPGDHIEEEVALEDAMYALQALRNTHLGGHSVEEPDAAAA
ncbi:MAG: hypothetical protein ABSD39_01075 [Terriglobales bacterium]|jgi:hypothetical protein